jgi:hypothetical protein
MGLGADSATHKDHRRKGVYKKLSEVTRARRFELGVDIGYWGTNNPIFIESANRKNRPKLPYSLTNMIKILDTQDHFGTNLFSKNGLKKIRYEILSKNNNRTVLKKNNSYILKRVKYFNEEAEVFWDSLKEYYRFIIERKRDYLNWRYCDIRAGNYVPFVLYEDRKMVGYMILEEATKNCKTGFIHDILVLPDKLDALDYLIYNALTFYEGTGINKVYCWCIEKTSLRKILESYGFVSNKKMVSKVYFTDEARDELERMKKASPDKIHFVLGDLDS